MTQFKLPIGAYTLASAFVLAIPAHAVTYYVGKTGSDENSCAKATTAITPKLTIPAGVKCLTGGDTLIIKAGTYVDQEIYNPPPGSPSAYTVITGDPLGPRPVIDPKGELGANAKGARGFFCTTGAACRYIELRYVEVTTAWNSVKLWGSDSTGYPHHVRFINNIFHDSITTNVQTSTSDTGFLGGDHLFQGNEFYRTGVGEPGYGPGHNTIYNPGNRTIIENNKFHNLANGVGVWQSNKYIQNVIVRSNVFYDIGRSNTDTWQQGNGTFSAVHMSVPGGGHQIYNNIIYRSGDEKKFAGIKVNPLWDVAGATNIQIYNNTIYDIRNASAYAILIVPKSGQQFVRNNIAYQAGQGIIGGIQSNNLMDDPSFMNPAGANFTLQSQSAAIDKGIKLDVVSTDYAGVLRPQGAGYDIGAYETGDGSSPLEPKDLSIQ